MANYGKITTFDAVKGSGMIQPEKGGNPLRFDRSALKWDSKTDPAVEQRLSYENGKDDNGNACAVGLQIA